MMWNIPWLARRECTPRLYHYFLYNLQYDVNTSNSTTEANSVINGRSIVVSRWQLTVILAFIVLFLLKHFFNGQSMNGVRKNIIPYSVFDMAKLAYKSENCEALIQYLKNNNNVDVNEKMSVARTTETQMTLFMCACFSGNERLLRFLLSYGADIHTKTKWEDTPLHLVTFALTSHKIRNFGSIDILIEAGCDLNEKNWVGNTPLSIAASHGNLRLIKYLLRKGADPSIGNNKGIYPIDFANNSDNREAAGLLQFDVPDRHVWEVVDPHTPTHIKLGLQSPSKQHLVDSTFTRRQSMRQKHVLK